MLSRFNTLHSSYVHTKSKITASVVAVVVVSASSFVLLV